MEHRWLRVTVHPNAGKSILIGLGPDRFEAWVKAKPIAGQANEAVIALLSRALQVAPERLRLVKGASSRNKLFRVLG